MKRPRILDLFCGAGGAGMGYHRAGFDVTGVDIAPQPRYPFEFVQADAIAYACRQTSEYARTWDAIHASPPCQDYSKNMSHLAEGYPRLIEPVRELLVDIGLPWVIENVDGAPLPVQDTLDGAHGVELCGSMFGLRIQRHRLFETSFSIAPPRGCNHALMPMNPHNAKARRNWRQILGEDAAIERTWREEMGVGWMGGPEGREAIPPAYTEHIGRQLLDALAVTA